ncbi:MAG: DUF3552 domain-containing protein, partial [Planctomycetia bacterium]|nr:DUF3552 domain-containing protein [Planctomycetia bacterium]
MPQLIAVLITAPVAFGLAIVFLKLIDYVRRRDAAKEARDIVERAQRDSENLRREAELAAKEQAIQQRAEGERELQAVREELHERERGLDKRQDALEQQTEQIRKQEKIVEGNQRKLTEQIADTRRRNEELKKVIDEERQKLHEISGLSR